MNQFDRLELLVNDKINLIKQANVLVIGLGGVGSYCVEALVRSGIHNITIVDNDIISITNLNRQLMTYHNNIGLYKTDEIEKRIKLINPNANVKKINKFMTLENINDLFSGKYDYVVDACDTISIKLELIRLREKYKYNLISCMATGNKMDPTKLQIIDVLKTVNDPIARIIRKMVRDEKIKKKVMVVCSTEVNKVKVKDKIPSNSYVPASAGLICASYVINSIVGDYHV